MDDGPPRNGMDDGPPTTDVEAALTMYGIRDTIVEYLTTQEVDEWTPGSFNTEALHEAFRKHMAKSLDSSVLQGDTSHLTNDETIASTIDAAAEGLRDHQTLNPATPEAALAKAQQYVKEYVMQYLEPLTSSDEEDEHGKKKSRRKVHNPSSDEDEEEGQTITKKRPRAIILSEGEDNGNKANKKRKEKDHEDQEDQEEVLIEEITDEEQMDTGIIESETEEQASERHHQYMANRSSRQEADRSDVDEFDMEVSGDEREVTVPEPKNQNEASKNGGRKRGKRERGAAKRAEQAEKEQEEMKKKVERIKNRLPGKIKKMAERKDKDFNLEVSLNEADPTGTKAQRRHEAENAALRVKLAKRAVLEAEKIEGGSKKAMDDGAASRVKQAKISLVQSKGEALAGLKEVFQKVPVDRIKFTSSAREPREEAIIDIMDNLVRGMLHDIELVIHAVKEGPWFIVEDGVQRVTAYQRLAKTISDMDDGMDTYETPEEEYEAIIAASQPLPSGHEPPLHEDYNPHSQPFTSTRKTNSYSWIAGLVIEFVPRGLTAEECAQYKAYALKKRYERTQVDKYTGARNVMKALEAEVLNKGSTASQLEELMKYDIDPGKHVARAVKVMSAGPSGPTASRNLQEVMKIHATLDSKTFLTATTDARKICQQTTDKILRQMKDGQLDPVIAEKMLKEHKKRAYYTIHGIGVDSETSLEIEERLEEGPRTVTILRHLMYEGRRLRKANLDKLNNNVDRILMEMERCMNPSLGFRCAQVKHRTVNDGEGVGKKGKDNGPLCIVNFISFKDLEKNPLIFRASAVRDVPSKYFVIWEQPADTSVDSVEGLFERSIEAMKVTLHATASSFTESHPNNVVEAVLIGSRGGKVQTGEQLSKEIHGLKLPRNIIDNEVMRRLMYDVRDYGTEPIDVNKYNTIFIHSLQESITAIVSDIALNRVYTSLIGDEMAQLETQLSELQKKRTKNGNTIDKKTEKKKPQEQATSETSGPKAKRTRKKAANPSQ